MPTISMFYGLIIRMYYAPKEHNPPHVHVYYQNQTAVVNFEGEVTEGTLSARHLKLVQAWIEIHKDELQANWNLCQNGEKPFKVESLK
ncbi:MAG: DUF4160 domain-containing protein [Bacteroidales bacterium]|nr:DUF4160 domain-containing protein [Bacteroidales bacterium]